jgi:single-strand selective monofunctional uracil DNA glycosylase
MSLVRISERLRERVDELRFDAPVTHVYNPLDYARAPHRAYLERYGSGKKRAVFLGMNPGPFGMAQTGVPFGEVRMVRDWMGIEAPVARPQREHDKRPIEGFLCKRSEVSGARLWGWAKDTFQTPDRFFRDFFVINYCPLCFMEESGKNRTPDKLPASEREPLYRVCDEAFRAMIETLEPEVVVGVGAFAEERAREALAGLPLRIGRILHPSPASPLANKDWPGQVKRGLRALGLL